MLKFLIILILILLPLGQLEKLPINNPQVGLYAHDLVVLVVCLFLIKEIIKKKKIIFGKFGKPIIIFLIIALISSAINSFNKTSAEIIIGFAYLARVIGFTGIYFAFLNLKIKTKPEFFKQLMIFSGLAAAVFGLIQYFIMPDIRPLTANEWDPHYYRVVGTYIEPGFAGLIFIFSLTLLIDKIWGKIKKQNLGYYLMVLISYAALCLTYSRSAYLSFTTAVALIAIVKKSFWFFIITMMFFILTISILPRPGGEGVKLERKSTMLSRFQNWQQGLTVAKDHWLLGVGFNFYRYTARDYGFLDKNRWQYSHSGAGVDNSLIFILATTGTIGFSAFIYLLISLFKWGYCQRKNSFVFLVILASTVIHGFFNNTFFYSFVMLQLWIILGFTENN